METFSKCYSVVGRNNRDIDGKYIVHIRLFIFRNIAVLYGLIRVYTFIRFVSNQPYTIFIWSMFITLNII